MQLTGTGGLAGVWSEENTRASLFDSMRRRETFATSGPRIRVRFFAGNDLPENIAESEDPVAIGYSKGVPMGGVLNGLSEAPQRFFIWASRDPNGGWLQRAQIIKGVGRKAAKARKPCLTSSALTELNQIPTLTAAQTTERQ